VIAALCRLLLRLAGWRIVEPAERPLKAVFVVYPHTSNWDFPLGLLYRFGQGLPIHWAAKDTLFFWPLGGLFRRIGGVPVNRRERTGFVEQMMREFETHACFYLAIAPEGTRQATGYLKSGFYRLALSAGVPLALACIDYARREVGVLAWYTPCGDEGTDLAALAAIYAGRQGRFPAQQAPFTFIEPGRPA